MESHMYQNLRKLINVVDELRDVGLQQYINLPRICVCGTQSSGKSSVLESIVGLDFLPRGEGVVTRRPLEMRLVHLSETEHKIDEAWAVFENNKSKKFTKFEEVRAEIDRLTEEVAGRNKGIIDDPIVLTIYATQCPDLTLIDLPGITRVPLRSSDQTDDIERITRDMSLRYAKDPRTIILAVIPANTDISTSDALQLARKVDPRGLRTIGVITKIDLMDRGTDATKMLNGEDIPLRLGYIGVRNRSQADIKERRGIKDALDEEKQFFATHPVYRSLPPHLLGSRALIDKLTKVLFKHIRSFLPEIKREINNKMRTVQTRMDELGQGVPVDVAERVQLIWTMTTDYCDMLKNTIRGKYDRKLQNYFEHEITGGAQIRSIFNELLDEYVDKDVTAEMTDLDIDNAIRMHEGDSLPGFPSPDTFEFLILPHLKKIHQPVIESLDRVSQALELLSQKIANRVFGRFPRLAEQVLELTQNIMLREKETCKKILEDIVSAETGYLFTNDSKYLMEHASMLPMNQQQQISNGQQPQIGPDGQPIQQIPGQMPGQMQPRPAEPRSAAALFNQMQQGVVNVFGAKMDKKKPRYSGPFINEIRKRLDSYFMIVLKNVRDTVPKTIGFFLVRQLQDKLQFELYNELNKAELLAELLGEPPHIMEERKLLTGQLDVLRKASQVLQRDPNIAALNIDGFDHEFDSDLQCYLENTSSGPQQPQRTAYNAPAPVFADGPAPAGNAYGQSMPPASATPKQGPPQNMPPQMAGSPMGGQPPQGATMVPQQGMPMPQQGVMGMNRGQPSPVPQAGAPQAGVPPQQQQQRQQPAGYFPDNRAPTPAAAKQSLFGGEQAQKKPVNNPLFQ